MEFKDYYKTMGVDEKATPEEIKKAYKKLARRFHPDVSKEPDAEQRFKEVGEAYEVLRDESRRREYDNMRISGAMGGNGQFRPPPGWESATHFRDGEGGAADFSDFFEAMFGHNGSFRRPAGGGMRMRGEDLHAELALLLEEAWLGCEQQIAVRIPEVDEHGLMSHRVRKLNIKVPPGTGDGSVLRIKGQGAPGMGDGGAGDLLVTIRLAQHPLYTVDGRNLALVVPLAPWEAALGCKLEVPTLKGKTRVTIPANSQSGQKLRLAGLGMPGLPPGDFFLVLKIVMPAHANEKARSLYEELQRETPFNPRSAWENKP
jgi:curved DNA-binding protein